MEKLHIGNHSLPVVTTLTLEELPMLQDFLADSDVCASVSWLRLSLPQLKTFLVGDNSFVAVKELSLMSLQSLEHFSTGDGSFAGATLTILCRSRIGFSHRPASPVYVVRGGSRWISSHDASHSREWALRSGLTQRCRSCSNSGVATGPS